MPTYEFTCKVCQVKEEATLPIPLRDMPRIHSCGNQMIRKMSLPQPAIIKLTGKGMAEATLNDGHALPDRPYKKEHEFYAAKGLEKPSRRQW